MAESSIYFSEKEFPSLPSSHYEAEDDEDLDALLGNLPFGGVHEVRQRVGPTLSTNDETIYFGTPEMILRTLESSPRDTLEGWGYSVVGPFGYVERYDGIKRFLNEIIDDDAYFRKVVTYRSKNVSDVTMRDTPSGYLCMPFDYQARDADERTEFASDSIARSPLLHFLHHASLGNTNYVIECTSDGGNLEKYSRGASIVSGSADVVAESVAKTWSVRKFYLVVRRKELSSSEFSPLIPYFDGTSGGNPYFSALLFDFGTQAAQAISLRTALEGASSGTDTCFLRLSGRISRVYLNGKVVGEGEVALSVLESEKASSFKAFMSSIRSDRGLLSVPIGTQKHRGVSMGSILRDGIQRHASEYAFSPYKRVRINGGGTYSFVNLGALSRPEIPMNASERLACFSMRFPPSELDSKLSELRVTDCIGPVILHLLRIYLRAVTFASNSVMKGDYLRDNASAAQYILREPNSFGGLDYRMARCSYSCQAGGVRGARNVSSGSPFGTFHSSDLLIDFANQLIASVVGSGPLSKGPDRNDEDLLSTMLPRPDVEIAMPGNRGMMAGWQTSYLVPLMRIVFLTDRLYSREPIITADSEIASYVRSASLHGLDGHLGRARAHHSSALGSLPLFELTWPWFVHPSITRILMLETAIEQRYLSLNDAAAVREKVFGNNEEIRPEKAIQYYSRAAANSRPIIVHKPGFSQYASTTDSDKKAQLIHSCDRLYQLLAKVDDEVDDSSLLLSDLILGALVKYSFRLRNDVFYGKKPRWTGVPTQLSRALAFCESMLDLGRLQTQHDVMSEMLHNWGMSSTMSTLVKKRSGLKKWDTSSFKVGRDTYSRSSIELIEGVQYIKCGSASSIQSPIIDSLIGGLVVAEESGIFMPERILMLCPGVSNDQLKPKEKATLINLPK